MSLRRPWLLLFALLLVGELLDQPLTLPLFEPAPTTVTVAPQDGLANVDSARALPAHVRELGTRPIPLKEASAASLPLSAPWLTAFQTTPLPWDAALASDFSSLLSIPLRC